MVKIALGAPIFALLCFAAIGIVKLIGVLA
jgi:hypothetical protein